MKLLLQFIGALSVFSFSHSQHAEKLENYPPPQAPFVAPAPQSGTWVLRVLSERSAVPGVRELLMIKSLKTDSIKKETWIYSDQKSEEIWFYYKTVIRENPADKNDIQIFDKTNQEDSMEFYSMESPGFQGVDWIKKTDYDRVVIFQGKPCYRFVRASMEIEAWVDVKTKLPVGVKWRRVLYGFVFENESVPVLKLPTLHQKAWDEYQKGIQRRILLEKESAIAH